MATNSLVDMAPKRLVATSRDAGVGRGCSLRVEGARKGPAARGNPAPVRQDRSVIGAAIAGAPAPTGDPIVWERMGDGGALRAPGAPTRLKVTFDFTVWPLDAGGATRRHVLPAAGPLRGRGGARPCPYLEGTEPGRPRHLTGCRSPRSPSGGPPSCGPGPPPREPPAGPCSPPGHALCARASRGSWSICLGVDLWTPI